MIEAVLPFSRAGLGSTAQVGGKNASLGELMAAWGDGALSRRAPPAASTHGHTSSRRKKGRLAASAARK